MIRRTPGPTTSRGPSRAAAALATGTVLLLPLTSCADSGEAPAAPPADPVTSVSASPNTEPTSSSPTASTTTPGEDSAVTSEGTAGSTPEQTSATDRPHDVALEHLEALAAGDADAAWEDLALTAQQTWPDRADFDAQVAQQAQEYAAMLDTHPGVTTIQVTDLSVTTLSGTVDPAGSPRVSAYTVVTGRDGVLSSPPDALPSLEWLNPTSEGAGSLGVAEYDTTAPVSVRLGPGATSFGVVVDGQRFDAQPQVEQGPDGGSTVSVEAPELSTGQHNMTVLYGYPGEVVGARALVLEVG